MSVKSWIATLMGVIGMGGAHGVTDASAQGLLDLSKPFAQRQAEADEACRRALEADTVEALEEYMREYWWARNACLAVAQSLAPQGGAGGPGIDGAGGYGG